MTRHRLGLHWLRMHPQQADFDHIRAVGYRSVKLFQWMYTDRNLCTDLQAILPADALYLCRDHPLSEQKTDMEQNPEETGWRHAEEWVAKVHGKRIHTPIEHTIFLGINEPDSNWQQAQINDYYAAFLSKLNDYGLRGGAMSFGVGHPSTKNLNPQGLPDWEPYRDVYIQMKQGDHVLLVHEYGMPDDYGLGYWCNRLQHCPWQVPIIVSECGIDSGVVGEFPSKGWRHYWTDESYYMDWIRQYVSLLDSRVHSVMPFTYDYTQPWDTFDVRPLRQLIEGYAQDPDQPAQPPLAEPPEDPGVPVKFDEFDRVMDFILRWEGDYQAIPEDGGNWTGGRTGSGELKGTKFGISAASYPHLDIKNLTEAQAVEIYRRDYWQASNAYLQEWPVNLIVMDTAVLHGVGAVDRWVGDDGYDPYAIVAKRLGVYTGSHVWNMFGRGWVNRVAALLEEIAE